MTTLNDLKKVGALKDSLREVSVNNLEVITFSQFKEMSNDERAGFTGIVAVDDYEWVATARGVKPTVSKKVISGNGLLIGSYDRKNKNFFLKKFVNRQLASIDTVKTNLDHKEVKEMAEQNMDFLDAFGEEALGGLKVEAEAEASETGAEVAATDKKSEEINQIKQKVSGEQLVDRKLTVSKNRKYGRLIGFVTKTDATVKLSKKQTVKKDAGRDVLDPGAPSEIKQKWENGEKVPAKYLLKRADIAFRHANPGAIVGAVIATPVDGEINLNMMSDANQQLKITEDTTLKYRYFPMEEAYVVLAAWYDGNIWESQDLLGAKASYVTEKFIPVTSKNVDVSQAPQFRVRLQQNTEVRSSLLCPENYFPLKTFVTVPFQNLTKEDAEKLNYNIESMLKNDTANELLSQLNEAEPDRVVKTPDGVVSKIFFEGASAGPDTCGDIVPFYDKKGTPLKEIEIAVRDKKESKSKPGMFTYPFEYRTLDDPEGPMSNPVYRRVFDSFKIPEDEFRNIIAQTTRTKRSSKKKKPTITTDDFLKAYSVGGMVQGASTTFAEIQDTIDGNIFG